MLQITKRVLINQSVRKVGSRFSLVNSESGPRYLLTTVMRKRARDNSSSHMRQTMGDP